MRIHYLQHVEFEGPGSIAEWAAEQGHSIKGSRLYAGEALPAVNDFDLLVIMGGPMSVNDEHEYEWLAQEKSLVRSAVDLNRALLGVCLGAQMIASAYGGRVYQSPRKEIGWFPVRRVTTEGIGALLPECFSPLHWHGETFDLPKRAVRLAETAEVRNQAFQLGARTVGLQFHIEATCESVATLVAKAGHEIEAGEPSQQSAESILTESATAIETVRPVLWRVLEHLTRSGD